MLGSIALALVAFSHHFLYPLGGFLTEAEVHLMVFADHPLPMREMVPLLRGSGLAYVGIDFESDDPDFLPGTPLSPVKLYFLKSLARTAHQRFRDDTSGFRFRSGSSIRDVAYGFGVGLYDGGSFDFDKLEPLAQLMILFDHKEQCIGLVVTDRRPPFVRTGYIFLRRWWSDKMLRGPAYDEDTDLQGSSMYPIPELPSYD